MGIYQTLAVSVTVGAVIAGLFALIQIPMNKRRKRTSQDNENADFTVLKEVAIFLQEWKGGGAPAENRARDLNRKRLALAVRDRLRMHESRKELEELERKN